MKYTWCLAVAGGLIVACTHSTSAQTPLGTEITYQGRLKLGGTAVNQPADVQFTLWGVEMGGVAPVAGPLVFDGVGGNEPPVDVIDGLFTVELDFGPGTFVGDALWLEVAVRVPAGSGAYTTLTPRQPVTAAPYALHALDATVGHSLDAVDGSPVDAVFVDESGNVGIGTTDPQRKIDVFSAQSGLRLTGLAPGSFGGILEFKHFLPSTIPGVTTPPGAIRFVDNTDTVLGSIEFFGLTLLPPPQLPVLPRMALNAPILALDAGGLILTADDDIDLTAVDDVDVSAGGTVDIESSDADIRLRTDGATRVIVDPLGNVGIGTTAPTAKLHVAGTPGADGIRFPDGTLQTTASIGSANSLDAADGSPVQALFVDADGNVGIGTTTPVAKLDVASPTDSVTLRLRYEAGTSAPVANLAALASNVTMTSSPDWDWLDRITLADGEYVELNFPCCNCTSEVLATTGFGFSVPPSATVTGVEVVIGEKGAGPGVTESLVQLSTSIGLSQNLALSAPWPSPAAPVTHGSPTNTWGLPLTPSVINDPQFAVHIQAAKDSAFPCSGPYADIDYVEVKVYLDFGIGGSAFYDVSASDEAGLKIGRLGLPELVLDPTGNLGVGTATPQARVDVAGVPVDPSALYSDDLIVSSADNTIVGLYSSKVSGGPASGIVMKNIDSSSGGALIDAWAMVREQPGFSGPGNGLRFAHGTTSDVETYNTALYLDDSGAVGIKTLNPEADLDVHGAAGGGATVRATGWGGWVELAAGAGGEDAAIIWGVPFGDLKFVNAFYGEYMRITTSGDVGIGTTTPDNKLHVFDGSAGTVTANPNAPLVVENDGDCFVNLLTTNGTEAGVLFGTEILGNMAAGLVYNDNQIRLDFRTLGTTRMSVSSVGVGIGTSTPDNTLHVFKGSAGSVTGNSNAPLVVENSTHCYVNVLGPDGSERGVLFGDPTGGTAAGGVIFDSANTTNGLQFRTNTNDTQMVITDTGNVGIGLSGPTFQLQLSTNSAAKPTSNTWTISSDARLKNNVEPLAGSLDKLLRLRGVSYQWIDPASQGGMEGRYPGLIAQDVEPVFPEWVGTDANGYKTLTVCGFEGLTVEALRELRREKDAQFDALRLSTGEQIQTLQTENAELRERLRQLEALVHQAIETNEKTTVGR